MNVRAFLSSEIKDFIRTHDGADIGALALKKMPESWDRALILDQIKARTKARHKLPTWIATENIIFPPPDLIEQCSSEATAQYKASIVNGKTFVDLTAGVGIDSWAMSSRFESGICIERDQNAAALLQHNFEILRGAQNDKRIEIINTAAESFIESMSSVNLVYIDPQRRDGETRGKFRLESCEPNIIALLPLLLEKSKTVMIKTSPVLDIDEAARILGCVQSIHVVEVQNECREVLYLCSKNASQDIPITAVSIDSNGTPLKTLTFTRAEESDADASLSQPLKYLYEPSAAFMKAGCFKTITARYGVKKLHPHTHLYASETLVPDFCGRSFTIEKTIPVDKKALKAALPDMKANLALRNFPDTVDIVKKRLGLKDGGDIYLFACTLADESRALVMGRRVA
jgi:16S rRNA G966 N2-methylase RsmD